MIGDAMLDEYYYVKSDRISPEFPIPVMTSEDVTPDVVEPGGAANVYNQMKFWNVDAKLLAFHHEHPAVSFISDRLRLPEGKRMPIKRRYYSGDFPLFRHDIETPNYGLETLQLCEMQEALVDEFKSMRPSVTILSDYNKGLFANVAYDIIRKILWHTHPTIVDPKKGPLSKWRGCTIIKPNAVEAKALTGQCYWRDQCDVIRQETDCEAVIITQGGDGVVGWHGDYFQHPAKKKVVPNSVVGAGDCYMAFLAMGLAQNFSLTDSMEFAFEAGSVYVQRRHNQPVVPSDFLRANKLVKAENLANRNYRLAFTNGCFDLLHPGHLETFRFAKSKADKLVVAVNSDASVALQSKSHKPVNDIDFRKKMLAALEDVDFVVEFDEETPYNLIRTIAPDVLVKGGDWPNPVGSDIVKEVYTVPIVPNYSTTNLINKIKTT